MSAGNDAGKGILATVMELLKQKTLVVGVCALAQESSAEEGARTAPAYFLDVNGVACGLVFTFWDRGNWVLTDRQFGTVYGEYETFDEAAAAVKDGAWVRQKHDELGAADPELAKKRDESKELYRVDNPLKGRPGITLIPNISAALNMHDEFPDDDDDVDDWSDEDDDWDDEDEWIDAKVEDEDEIEDDWDAVEDDVQADWDSIEDDEEDDWDDIDDDWDDIVDARFHVPLEPRAAYIVDIARMPVAIYSMLHMGDIAWWEAFDIGTGIPLWSTQSLSELMRVAPLFLVMARSLNEPDETTPYLESILDLFDGLPRQTGEDYLRTGYLKANGREYLELLNRLYADPLTLEDAFAAASRSEGE